MYHMLNSSFEFLIKFKLNHPVYNILIFFTVFKKFNFWFICIVIFKRLFIDEYMILKLYLLEIIDLFRITDKYNR